MDQKEFNGTNSFFLKNETPPPTPAKVRESPSLSIGRRRRRRRRKREREEKESRHFTSSSSLSLSIKPVWRPAKWMGGGQRWISRSFLHQGRFRPSDDPMWRRFHSLTTPTTSSSAAAAAATPSTPNLTAHFPFGSTALEWMAREWSEILITVRPDGLYLVLPSFGGSEWRLPSFTGFYCNANKVTYFYWVSVSRNGVYLVLPGFNATKINLPSFTGFYFDADNVYLV